MKTEHVNPGQSAAKALHKELLQRGGPIVSSVGNSASSCKSPGLKPHVIKQIQLATQRSSCRASIQAEVNFHCGESSDSGGSKILGSKRSLPTPKCTTSPAAATQSLLKSAGKPGGPTGTPKKRRTRASKKPPTTIVQAKSEEFRDLVQSLTGGTYCSQTSATASPMLSASPVTKNSPEHSDPAPGVGVVAPPEPYVVRPHPTRIHTNGIVSDSISPGSEVQTAPSMKVSLPVSQELPEVSYLFESSEEAGNMNDMMGYERQNYWSQWGSFESLLKGSESIGVSSSTQSEPSSACVYPMPYLLEEADVSKDVSSYQREVQLASDGLKATETGNLLPRHLPHSEEEIDSWFRDHTPHKGMYTN